MSKKKQRNTETYIDRLKKDMGMRPVTETEIDPDKDCTIVHMDDNGKLTLICEYHHTTLEY